MEFTIKKLVPILRKYKKKLEAAAFEVEYYDYDLSMIARFKKKAFIICYQFRPERDGYTGYKLIEEDYLDEIIEKYK